jgi:hypothetical protein
MLCDRQICPRGRYKGTGTIGQYKRQMKFAASMTPAKHIKRRSFKGMARPNDGYLIGKAVEMMSAVVGSLSSSLSTASIGSFCSRQFAIIRTARGCCSTSSAG